MSDRTQNIIAITFLVFFMVTVLPLAIIIALIDTISEVCFGRAFITSKI